MQTTREPSASLEESIKLGPIQIYSVRSTSGTLFRESFRAAVLAFHTTAK